MNTRMDKYKEIEENIKQEKKEKIKKILYKILLIVIIILGILLLYMNKIEPKMLKINEYNIINNKIPQSFNGTKILHISDILYKTTTNKNTLKNIEEKVKLTNPDIIIITGNITSIIKQTEEDIKELNNFLKEISKNKETFIVKGDQDTEYSKILKNTEITKLDNETKELYNKQNEKIIITNNLDNEENTSYKITIINNYDNYKNNNSDLILAGNNLRGEIYLGKPILSKNKYKDNYYEKNNAKIYISNGIGSNHKLRLFNPPSLNIYRLYTN